MLEWTTNGALQLHRFAQEELNMGTWSGGTDVIPTTKGDEILASLDISDKDHPVLARPVGNTEQKFQLKICSGKSLEGQVPATDPGSIQDNSDGKTLTSDHEGGERVREDISPSNSSSRAFLTQSHSHESNGDRATYQSYEYPAVHYYDGPQSHSEYSRQLRRSDNISPEAYDTSYRGASWV
jgi:hypothetical protein